MVLSGTPRRVSRLVSALMLAGIAATINACSNPMAYSGLQEDIYDSNPEMQKAAQQRMEDAKANLKTIDDVRELQKQFHYVSDSVDWTPNIELLFAHNLEDDCDGAAVLGKWSLTQIGINSRIVYLYGKNIHAVCISDDNSIMITNNEVVKIPQKKWEEAVLTYFTPAYSSMKVVN